MNALKYIFHEASSLLCQFHIDKNVKVKCKTYVVPKEAWDQVMKAWGSVKDFPTQSEYEGHVKMLKLYVHHGNTLSSM